MMIVENILQIKSDLNVFFFTMFLWSLSLCQRFSHLFIIIFLPVSCKMCNLFFTIFLTQMAIDFKLLQVDYIKCLHCQQLFCWQKPILKCSFKDNSLGHETEVFFFKSLRSAAICFLRKGHLH